MATVPWLTTPGEQLAAMEAGARTGLARRAQNQGDLEAAQKLNLAYNELSAQNFRAGQVEKARQQHAAEQLMMQQQRLDEMKYYHDAQIEKGDAAHTLKKSVHVVPGVGLVEYDPDKGAANVLTPTTYKNTPTKLSGDDLVEAKDVDAKLADKRKEIASAKKEAASASDEKTKASKTQAVKDLEAEHEKLLSLRKAIGKPGTFSPVMGKKQEADAASMLDTPQDPLPTTSSGYKWREVK